MTPRRLDALRRRANLLDEARDEKADARAALVACLIANANRKKGRRPYKIADFMPRRRRRKTGWKDQLAFVRHLNLVFGGTDETAKAQSED